MIDEELIKKHQAAYEFLDRQGIYILRQYGRPFGVATPTTRKKKELIIEIMKLALGIKKRSNPSKKGARAKTKPLAYYEIEEFCNMLNVNPGLFMVNHSVEKSTVFNEKDIMDKIQKLLGGYLKKGKYNFKGKITLQEDDSFEIFVAGDMEKL